MAAQRVAVIGAGIGGLVAALRLAHAGLDVTVLERAAAPGGKMRSVAADGARVEAGPTVFTMRWVFEEIFSECGADLSDRVRLSPASILARHAWGADQRLDLFADPEESAAAIRAFAGPREEDGYRRFRARAAEVYGTLEGPFIRGERPSPVDLGRRVGLSGLGGLLRIQPFTTLWGALGEYFRDLRLRQLFGRYATYCGSSPFEAPATLMLVAHVESQGVWHVEGGLSRLAAIIAKLAQENGARIRYRAEVAAIAVENGRGIVGVDLADGERIAADLVVANADAAALGAGLFGVRAARAVEAVPPNARSLSAVTLCARAQTSGFPLVRHNVFFSRDYANEFAELRAGRLPDDPTIYVCAQDRADDDSALDRPERLLCLVNAPALGRERPLAPTEIATCETNLRRKLTECGLTIEATPGTVTTDPAGFERLFPATGGRPLRPGLARLDGLVQASGGQDGAAGAVSRGGQRPSGAGGADGGAIGADRGGQPAGRSRREGPRFDTPVARDGYVWWYVDALSEDGRQGLTIIAFIGSVFSPYYALDMSRDPFDHCTMNVVLYGERANRFCMTERGRDALSRDASQIRIGPSGLAWDGTTLTITLDEVTAPIPSRVRGTIRLRPNGFTRETFTLDAEGRHRWWPMAPSSPVEVTLDAPSLSWRGTAYFDTNHGDTALVRDFRDWTWCRADLKDGSAILYDVRRRDGSTRNLSLRFAADGTRRDLRPPRPAALPPTRFWRMPRATRSDDGASSVVRTFEDTPFYARSLLASTLDGEPVRPVHESLSLTRFANPLVQFMLPFRMPRRAG